METLGQCEERVLQLQERIAELERDNTALRAQLSTCQQAEASLKRSPARFQAMFEQSPLSIQMISPDGRIQQVNRAWEQLFNLTLEEVAHYNMLEDPQLIEKGVMPLVERGFAGEVVILPPIRYDAGRVVVDGRETWAHGIFYPIKDEVGEVVEVVLVHQDTTDWWQAEQKRLAAVAEKQAAIFQERERAAIERVAELAKVNDALRQTVDVLATSDLNNFLGHVLKAIAEQFDAPLTEYWFHQEPHNIAYLGLSYCQGQILTPAEQAGHPGVVGFPVPPEMIHNESLHHRKRHFVVEDVEKNRFHVQVSDQIGVDVGAWYVARGVQRQINVPLVLDDKCIGALLVFIPGDRSFTNQQIELAYALAQLVTLAIQLTQLAEQARLAAIATEQEKAAREQAALLAKANDTLKQTLDVLATEPELDKFIGHVLQVIAHQIPSPLTEYWYHSEGDIVYIGMMSWQGRVYSREEIVRLYPTHPGIVGFQVTPELIHGESLQHRKRYFISDDWHTNPLIDSDPYNWSLD